MRVDRRPWQFITRRRESLDADGRLRWLLAESAWIWFFIAFVGYWLRRPQSLLRAEFTYEDGKIFYLGSWFGSVVEQLTRPYAGYVNLIPRATGALERLVPPAWAPFVSNLVAITVAALIVRFIASDRLRGAIPDRRLRWACALLLIVLPGMDMVHGSITFIQFYLGVFLIAAAIASPAASLPGAILTRASLLVAALTGPFVVLFLPLYVGRAVIRRDRDSMWSLAAVSVGAAVQILTLLVAGGRSAVQATVNPIDVARVVGVHLATGFIGTRFMIAAVAAQPPFLLATAGILGLCVLLVLAFRSVPRSWLAVGGYVWVATVGSALVNGSDSTDGLIGPLSVSRYFIIPWFALGVLILASAVRRNPAGLVLLLILGIGIVGDFRLPSGWNYGWSAQAACVGDADPCSLRIFPGIDYWTLQWPGLAATQGRPGP